MSDDTLTMAWNEPGKGQDEDPWQRKSGGNGGPPDLDALFKKLGQKFKGVFGSKNASPLGSVGGVLIIVVLVVGYFVSGFYRVNPPEQAVRMRFGRFVAVENPGLHWLPPIIESKKIVDINRIEALSHSSSMLTEDENIVTVGVNVQYRVEDPKAYLFNNVEPQRSLKEASESALRQVVGNLRLDQVLTTEPSTEQSDTGQAAGEMLSKSSVIQGLIQDIMDLYQTGIRVTAVNVLIPEVPTEVKDAFANAVRAREILVTKRNEAQGYYNKRTEEVKGQVERILQDAQAYQQEAILSAQGETKRFELVLPEYLKAPDITQKRMYLGALESVLGNSSKVLLDKGDNNNLLVLPLDRLLTGQQSTAKSSLPALPVVAEQPADTSRPTPLKRTDSSKRSGRSSRRS